VVFLRGCRKETHLDWDFEIRDLRILFRNNLWVDVEQRQRNNINTRAWVRKGEIEMIVTQLQI
jgi:hypothetical protein